MLILIEGSDLVGKSTTCSSILERLKKEQFNVRYWKGRVPNNPIHRVLERFPAPSNPLNRTLNGAYILGALFDRFLGFPESSEQIILCESYVDRAVAYGSALGFGLIPQVALQVPSLFLSFDLAVLLETSLEERRRRLRVRKNPNTIDEITTASQEVHLRMKDAYDRIMVRHKYILSFDTSQLNVNQITDEVVNFIRRQIN
jgi:thymidylate kinase